MRDMNHFTLFVFWKEACGLIIGAAPAFTFCIFETHSGEDGNNSGTNDMNERKWKTGMWFKD